MIEELPTDVIQESGMKLRLLKFISRGTFGCVYEGTFNGHLVAVKKQLSGVSVDGEYGFLASFNSDYIVKAISSVSSILYNYIIMEKGDMNLNEYLKTFKEDVKKSSVFAHIAWHLISGLHELQKMDIIHRDFKPQNIIVMNKSFKIADFGLAIKASRRPKTKKGTRRFIAPEVILEKVYDVKADIWSLGVTFFFICTQEYPFTGWHSPQLHLLSIAKQIDLGALKADVLKATKNIYAETLVTEPTIFTKHIIFFRQKQLILNCLKCDPSSRPSASDLLKHGLFLRGPKANIDDVPSAIFAGSLKQM